MLSPDRAAAGATPAALFDDVARPKHYIAASGLEARHVIADWDLAFNLGNAVKYILRAGRKGPARQDLEKALQYLDFVSLDIAAGRSLIEWRSHRVMRLSAEEVAIAFGTSNTLTIALGAIRSLAKAAHKADGWVSIARREVARAIRELDEAAAKPVLDAARAVA